MIDRKKSYLTEALYNKAKEHHSRVCGNHFVVMPSIPILFFGDIDAYHNSPVRILTAALNPSNQEFPFEPSKSRFDLAHAGSSLIGFEQELSKYFEHNPYWQWFRNFEMVLNGAGASYGGKYGNSDHKFQTLHVDIGSPIATCPTCSELDPGQRAILQSDGKSIFKELLTLLEPNIVIASVGKQNLRSLGEEYSDNYGWSEIIRHENSESGIALSSPLSIHAKQLRLASQHEYWFANGSAAQTPFGKFCKFRKREAGQDMLKLIDRT